MAPEDFQIFRQEHMSFLSDQVLVNINDEDMLYNVHEGKRMWPQNYILARGLEIRAHALELP